MRRSLHEVSSSILAHTAVCSGISRILVDKGRQIRIFKPFGTTIYFQSKCVLVVGGFFGSICGYYVASGVNFKAKAWKRICGMQLLLDKISTIILKLFISTPWIAPIGGMIIEVNPTP